MGWLKRSISKAAQVMGFADADADEDDENIRDTKYSQRRTKTASDACDHPDRAEEIKFRQPVIQYARSQLSGEFIGGLQGLRWFCECLRVNEDGDQAHDFFNEMIEAADAADDCDRGDDHDFAMRESFGAWERSRRAKSGEFIPIRVENANVVFSSRARRSY